MWKRKLCVLFILLFTLSGCSEKYPQRTQDGIPWDKNWTILGTNLGIESPGYDFELSENPVVLSGDDTYYATFTVGKPTKFVNDEGKETDLYKAELYVLLYGCGDESQAQQAYNDWMEREKDTYSLLDTKKEDINGQIYEVITYTCPNESNPYQRGISAFTIHNNYVFVVELLCLESYEEDEQEILKHTLEGCHFAAE